MNLVKGQIPFCSGFCHKIHKPQLFAWMTLIFLTPLFSLPLAYAKKSDATVNTKKSLSQVASKELYIQKEKGTMQEGVVTTHVKDFYKNRIESLSQFQYRMGSYKVHDSINLNGSIKAIPEKNLPLLGIAWAHLPFKTPFKKPGFIGYNLDFSYSSYKTIVYFQNKSFDEMRLHHSTASAGLTGEQQIFNHLSLGLQYNWGRYFIQQTSGSGTYSQSYQAHLQKGSLYLKYEISKNYQALLGYEKLNYKFTSHNLSGDEIFYVGINQQWLP